VGVTDLYWTIRSATSVSALQSNLKFISVRYLVTLEQREREREREEEEKLE